MQQDLFGLGKDSSAERLKLSYFAVKKVLIDFKSIRIASNSISGHVVSGFKGVRAAALAAVAPVRHQQLCVQPCPAAPADRIVRSVRRYRPLAQRFRHLSGSAGDAFLGGLRAEIRLCRYGSGTSMAWRLRLWP